MSFDNIPKFVVTLAYAIAGIAYAVRYYKDYQRQTAKVLKCNDEMEKSEVMVKAEISASRHTIENVKYTYLLTAGMMLLLSLMPMTVMFASVHDKTIKIFRMITILLALGGVNSIIYGFMALKLTTTLKLKRYGVRTYKNKLLLCVILILSLCGIHYMTYLQWVVECLISINDRWMAVSLIMILSTILTTVIGVFTDTFRDADYFRNYHNAYTLENWMDSIYREKKSDCGMQIEPKQ